MESSFAEILSKSAVACGNVVVRGNSMKSCYVVRSGRHRPRNICDAGSTRNAVKSSSG